MLPIILRIGPLPIHSYGLMIAVGFLLALYVGQRETKKLGLDPQVFGDMAFWALIIGLIGTRVLHIIMFPEYYSWKDPIGWIAIWRGGLVFHGGPPPAIIFCYFYLRKKGFPIWKIGDVAMPCLALAHAMGRVGCFLNGCCYGHCTDLPWGIRFPRVPFDLSQEPTGSPPYMAHCRAFSDLSFFKDQWSLTVHPTQLYESFGLLAIFFLLMQLRKRWRPFDGFTLPLYLMFYGALRFFIEFLRGDHNPTHFNDMLSDQQVFCLLFVVVGAVLFTFMSRRARKTAN